MHYKNKTHRIQQMHNYLGLQKVGDSRTYRIHNHNILLALINFGLHPVAIEVITSVIYILGSKGVVSPSLFKKVE